MSNWRFSTPRRRKKRFPIRLLTLKSAIMRKAWVEEIVRVHEVAIEDRECKQNRERRIERNLIEIFFDLQAEFFQEEGLSGSWMYDKTISEKIPSSRNSSQLRR
jgi:hypothetical protein